MFCFATVFSQYAIVRPYLLTLSDASILCASQCVCDHCRAKYKQVPGYNYHLLDISKVQKDIQRSKCTSTSSFVSVQLANRTRICVKAATLNVDSKRVKDNYHFEFSKVL